MTAKSIHDEIEPRIRPLVEALNGTGLFTTFSSCEGHFEAGDDLAGKGRAAVCFHALKDVTEARVEEFFTEILAAYLNSLGEWGAGLSVMKIYVPNAERAVPLEYFYAFEIRPFNPRASSEAKRKAVDDLIREISRRVRDHSK